MLIQTISIWITITICAITLFIVALPARFAYFPFGGSPHQSIGQGFALLEAALAVATAAQRDALESVPDHPLELHASVTLRQGVGLEMRLRPEWIQIFKNFSVKDQIRVLHICPELSKG